MGPGLIRLGVDIRPLQTAQRYQGVGHYTWGLLSGFSKLNLPWRLVLFYDRGLATDFDLPSGLSVELVGIWRPRWEPRTREVWNQLLTPIDVLKHGVSLLHVTAPEFVSRWLPVPQVVTIFDLILFSEFSPLKTGIKYRFLYHAAAQADGIIAISRSTSQDFLELFEPDPERVRVIYLGVDERFLGPISTAARRRVRTKYHLGNPFVLYLGDLRSPYHNARKNLSGLLAAFAKACQQVDQKWWLVLAGKCGEYSESLSALSKQLGIGEQIIFTDYVFDEDLPSLMAAADIFAYPSRYEGFGLPVLQAMAVGTPVLTSDRASIPEICGDAALMVNPDDPSSLAAGLFHLMNDSASRQMLAEKGKVRAARFTWVETARETKRVYEEAMKNR